MVISGLMVSLAPAPTPASHFPLHSHFIFIISRLELELPGLVWKMRGNEMRREGSLGFGSRAGTGSIELEKPRKKY